MFGGLGVSVVVRSVCVVLPPVNFDLTGSCKALHYFEAASPTRNTVTTKLEQPETM